MRIDSGGETVEVAGTGVGPRNVPYLVRAWGQNFYLPFADHLVVFRYTRPARHDRPGRCRRSASTASNIVSAAVGAESNRPRPSWR